MAGVEDVEAEEALAEFDFLVSETGEGAGEAQSHGDGPEWGKIQKLFINLVNTYINKLLNCMLMFRIIVVTN